MLQALNMPISQSVVNFTNGSDAQQDADHQLEKQILLCREASNAILQFIGPIMITKWFTRSGHSNCIDTWI